jgi:hypothetical protein
VIAIKAYVQCPNFSLQYHHYSSYLGNLGQFGKNRIAASNNFELPKVAKASVVLATIGAVFT